VTKSMNFVDTSLERYKITPWGGFQLPTALSLNRGRVLARFLQVSNGCDKVLDVIHGCDVASIFRSEIARNDW
jgi:hypothetical protein